MKCVLALVAVTVAVLVEGQVPGMPPMPGMPAGMPGMPGMPPAPAPGAHPPGPPAAAAPGMPTGGMYPHVTSSHCRYLMNAPSPWGTNASPFKLYTRSYSGEVRRGYPVEVSILPFYEAFKFFNFTDFALWTELHTAKPPPPPRGEFAPPAPPTPAPGTAKSHLGVWQVFPQYAGGSGSMKCSLHSKGEDTVGSFEERMLDLLKTQFPFDGRLNRFNPSARHGAAFLWYPDERTMSAAASIKFVAKLKSFGQWFTLESTPWRVYQPPPPPPRMGARRGGMMGGGMMGGGGGGGAPRPPPMDMSTMLEQMNTMAQQARSFERNFEAAGNGAL